MVSVSIQLVRRMNLIVHVIIDTACCPQKLFGPTCCLGAVLSPHADRLPLVSSCIVNVAQDVDEPWNLEVIDRFGNSVNVTMEPGDMVLYESGSLIHRKFTKTDATSLQRISHKCIQIALRTTVPHEGKVLC